MSGATYPDLSPGERRMVKARRVPALTRRRAVACVGWRWMPGMLNTYGRRISENLCELVWDESEGRWEETDGIGSDCLPDLDDFATLGCIEHGLLPSLGFNDAIIDASSNARDGEVRYYIVYRPDPVSFPTKWLSAVEDGSPTKADALIAALEAGR